MKKIKGFQQSLTESHKVPKNTAATQTPSHQPRPTVQKTEQITDSANEDQFFKLVSPPKPTIHLHSPKSTLTSQSQSPLSMQMDIVTLRLLQLKTSKQIHELQELIYMQLEFQQLLVQQLANFGKPAAVDQSSSWSATFNAMPRVPPGFEPLIKKEFENLEKPISITKNIDGQEELAQAPKFCKDFLNKGAGKNVCLANNPKLLQHTLNLVKKHQSISQAVGGQKTKGCQAQNKHHSKQVSLEEVKKVVAEAIKLENKKAKSSDSCFFCKKSGHFKKNCNRYKAWLQKKRVKKAEFKRVRTENIDLAPQSFVKEQNYVITLRQQLRFSYLNPEPVLVSNQTKILVVSVSNQTKGEINSTTIVDPNPLNPYRAAS